LLSRFDDFPIHQTPEPVALPASSDRNVYDRYWLNGFDRDGRFYFGVAMGLYPNRGILDSAFSIVIDGEQHCFFASRRAPSDPSDTAVGPFRIDVMEPMRSLRLTIDDNQTGISCSLTFAARTACVEEGRQTLRRGSRIMMDATRFAQFGRWQGEIRYAGNTLRVESAQVFGTKDRSWGIRPVGEPETGGAPITAIPQFFFLWAPIHWEKHCTHFGTFEDEAGHAWHSDGAIVPAYGSPEEIPGLNDPGIVKMVGIEHELVYEPGTRRAQFARLALVEPTMARHEIELEPLIAFRMKGIGYTHPEWSHGRWKGELAVGGDAWKTSELNPIALDNQHIQQLVRARMGEEVGIGTLEQLCIGPHARYGFKSLLDGAPEA
jgi:hypothetical protein